MAESLIPLKFLRKGHNFPFCYSDKIVNSVSFHGADASFLFPVGGEFILNGAQTPSGFESKVQSRDLNPTNKANYFKTKILQEVPLSHPVKYANIGFV